VTPFLFFRAKESALLSLLFSSFPFFAEGVDSSRVKREVPFFFFSVLKDYLLFSQFI